MKQRNLYRIIIVALMLLSGLISAVFEPGGSIFSTILIAGGSAFLAVGILRHRQYREGPESDERSKKIGAYGLSYAWLTGIFVYIGIVLAGFPRDSQDGNTESAWSVCNGACNFSRVVSDVPGPKRRCRVNLLITMGGIPCRRK
jgi:hypothetical protein